MNGLWMEYPPQLRIKLVLIQRTHFRFANAPCMEYLAVKWWIHLWSHCFDHWDLEQQPVPWRTVFCWAISKELETLVSRWPKKWMWKLLWSLTCANIITRHPVWWLLHPVGVSPQKFILYSCHDCVSSCFLGSLSLTLPCLSKIIHHPLEATSSMFFCWIICFIHFEDPQVAHAVVFADVFLVPVVEQDVLQESLHPYAAWKTSGGYLYRPIGWLDHFLILADAPRWIVLAPPNGILYDNV